MNESSTGRSGSSTGRQKGNSNNNNKDREKRERIASPRSCNTAGGFFWAPLLSSSKHHSLLATGSCSVVARLESLGLPLFFLPTFSHNMSWRMTLNLTLDSFSRTVLTSFVRWNKKRYAGTSRPAWTHMPALRDSCAVRSSLSSLTFDPLPIYQGTLTRRPFPGRPLVLWEGKEKKINFAFLSALSNGWFGSHLTCVYVPHREWKKRLMLDQCLHSRRFSSSPFDVSSDDQRIVMKYETLVIIYVPSCAIPFHEKDTKP